MDGDEDKCRLLVDTAQPDNAVASATISFACSLDDCNFVYFDSEREHDQHVATHHGRVGVDHPPAVRRKCVSSNGAVQSTETKTTSSIGRAKKSRHKITVDDDDDDEPTTSAAADAPAEEKIMYTCVYCPYEVDNEQLYHKHRTYHLHRLDASSTAVIAASCPWCTYAIPVGTTAAATTTMINSQIAQHIRLHFEPNIEQRQIDRRLPPIRPESVLCPIDEPSDDRTDRCCKYCDILIENDEMRSKHEHQHEGFGGGTENCHDLFI